MKGYWSLCVVVAPLEVSLLRGTLKESKLRALKPDKLNPKPYLDPK